MPAGTRLKGATLKLETYETQGDDFGNYGIMRFQRAISNLEKLEMDV